MPRTKGAKGKKTLAKEMGMTLEQYELYLRGKEIGLPKSKENLNFKKEELIQKNLNSPSESKTRVTTSERKIPPDLEQFLDKVKEDIQKDPEPDKYLLNPDKINQDKLQDKPQEEINESKKRKKEKEIILCERCHQSIIGYTPFKINLTSLTTYPGYHRQTQSENDRILLCDECKKELNKLIDKWLWNNGSGIPLKFGAVEYQEDC